ncbi:MAG: hypothetical protein ACTSSJ_01350 [Candidatus Odinarchaeia archaeon]
MNSINLNKTKVIALIGIMGALGNLAGMLGIPIPSPVGTIEFHFSQLPALLVACLLGGIPGAVTGAISTIYITLLIGNPFIPLGNAILAGIAGWLTTQYGVKPVIASLIGECAEAPYTAFAIFFWVSLVGGVDVTLVTFAIVLPVIGKSFLEVLIAGFIVHIILRKKEEIINILT